MMNMVLHWKAALFIGGLIIFTFVFFFFILDWWVRWRVRRRPQKGSNEVDLLLKMAKLEAMKEMYEVKYGKPYQSKEEE